MRDLELRGAGNLLGDEQSGHVAALGFELYMQMLDEAVRGDGRARTAARTCAEPVRLDVNVDAYVPADYIPYEQAKVDVAPPDRGRARGAELEELRAELDDRFGEPPEPLENLITLQQARIKLGEAGARAVTFRQGRLPSRRSSSTPCGAKQLRERDPGRAVRVGQVAALDAGARRPGQRFPAVVRAADALLAVQREAA